VFERSALRNWIGRIATLTALTVATNAQGAGIDSDSQSERALADDKPTKGSLADWYRGKSPEPQEDEAAPLTEQELRALFPDLEVETTESTPFRMFLGTVAPFQLFGVGVGTDFYVWSRLRLSSSLILGAMAADPGRMDWEFNVYGEAGVGIAAFRWQSRKAITWPVPKLRSKPIEGELRAIVPSAHALEVEVGALSGHHMLYRCTGNCAAQESSEREYTKAALQVVMPYAGLRYVYFRRASSQRAHISVAQRFQLGVHAVLRPFVQPAADLVNEGTQKISRHKVGFRVVSQLPFGGCKPAGICEGLDLAIGWLPSPASFYLSATATFLVGR
jgi:hypothetical protein